MQMKQKQFNLLDFLGVCLIEGSFVVIFIILFPFYLLNRIDFRIKGKKNPFYKSIAVRLAENHPLFYEICNSLWNYPLFSRVYSILPDFSGRVLQVGCGTGLLNKYLKSKKNTKEISLINLDMNEKYLTYGLRKKRYEKTMNASIYKVPLADKSLDIIIFARCFHHIQNHKKTFKECARLLVDSGLIIITDPISLVKNESLNQYKRNGYMANSSVDGVIWRFSKQSFESHIKECLSEELEVVSFEYKRQKDIVNYNFKYPQTDVVAVIKKRYL